MALDGQVTSYEPGPAIDRGQHRRLGDADPTPRRTMWADAFTVRDFSFLGYYLALATAFPHFFGSFRADYKQTRSLSTTGSNSCLENHSKWYDMLRIICDAECPPSRLPRQEKVTASGRSEPSASALAENLAFHPTALQWGGTQPAERSEAEQFF